MSDTQFALGLTYNEDNLMRAVWCVRCYGDKDKKEAAQFVYKGFSLCTACLEKVREIEKGNEEGWRYSLGL